jgi:uncharacterized protein
MKGVVATLHRYPVKGLSPEPLGRASLAANDYFPGDRIMAVENGPSGFDPAAAEHLPKQRFLMLMKQAKLARLRSAYDDTSGVLTFRQGGHVVASGNVATAEGRAAIESYLTQVMADDLRGPLKLLRAPPGYRFTDSRKGFVSLLNLESVAAIAKLAGRSSLDPLRFRANIAVNGWPAWSEAELVGKTIRIGGAVLEITKPIDRCAATDVDPSLGVRDMSMVALLERSYSHHDCGIYARIVEAGDIAKGDAIIFQD